jgi:hypothetical protein
VEGMRYFTIQYITFHSLDPELVKMIVGCGIYHINTKTCVQNNWSCHIRKHNKIPGNAYLSCEIDSASEDRSRGI